MTYATRADMEAIYSADYVARLADRDDDGSDEQSAQSALVSATSLINSYLGQRYTVPLPVPPQFIALHCIDIAIYTLANSAARLTDDIEKRNTAALKHLADIAAGKAGLGELEAANSVEADPDTGSGSIMIDADERRYTHDSMKGV